MISFLATALIGAGVSKKLATPLVYLGLIAAGVGTFFVAKAIYDHAVIQKHEQKIEHRARPATDQAANERARDQIQNSKDEQEMHDVIAAQPDQPITPTSRAHACEQLRRAGRHSAACR